ncbi:MAG: hypothetical protein BGO78_00275 [Chloroflexi bacterium 44-23]|nr:MAG: hypothetical protein BGO78_00275 [Chloroflexi bacterium 44-23]
MNQPQLIWSIISFILTLMIMSYFIKDNPLFKVAAYLFVGVTTGYIAVILIYQVLLPKLINPFFSGDQQQLIFGSTAFILCLLLLTKFSTRFNRWGSIPMAIVVGVGAATIISGAIFGTFFPQIGSTSNYFQLTNNNQGNLLLGLYVLVGSILTLLYFQFTIIPGLKFSNNDSKLYLVLRFTGKVFIGITLGSIFASVILSALMAMIGRIDFLISFIKSF